MKLQNKLETIAAKYYKYWPVTSFDVERVFSAFKIVLNVKEQNLAADNVGKCVVGTAISRKEIIKRKVPS